MLFRRFRCHRYSSALGLVAAPDLHPLGVKDARFIDALVSMRAEEIALRLQEIRGQPRLAIAVEVGERGAKGGHGDAMLDRGGDGDAPVVLRLLDDVGEIGIEQKIVQRGIALVGFDDSIQEISRE